jgi:hypothetical protein
MIIDNTYFKGEIYIPHATPMVTDQVTGVDNKIQDFIWDYVYECLFKSLGSILLNEFIGELDGDNANGLVTGADAKWDNLLNGHTYNDPQTGKAVVWRGLRFKSTSKSNYDRSLLAYYVYYHYESNDFITRSDIGNQQEQGKNAIAIIPNQKVVKAWRKFVYLVQGESVSPRIIERPFGYGIDYYSQGDEEVSLYKFIEDQNEIVEDTYAEFNPKTWTNINEFGI